MPWHFLSTWANFVVELHGFFVGFWYNSYSKVMSPSILAATLLVTRPGAYTTIQHCTISRIKEKSWLHVIKSSHGYKVPLCWLCCTTRTVITTHSATRHKLTFTTLAWDGTFLHLVPSNCSITFFLNWQENCIFVMGRNLCQWQKKLV